MAVAAASPAASESENKRGEVTYRFCPEWYALAVVPTQGRICC